MCTATTPTPLPEAQAWIAKLGYEIRSSVNSMLGLADILLETGLTVEQREYVDVLRFSAGRLLSTAGDIMELTGPEADGAESPANIKFNVRDLLVQTVDLMRVLAEQAPNGPMQIELDTTGLLQSDFTGDRRRLEQILLTLIGAALQSGKAGAISVRASTSGSGLVSFEIAGPPVGVGGDVPIRVAGRMVNFLGGQLQVDQTGERGAFAFDLKLAPSVRGASGTSVNGVTTRRFMRVLVAEDTPDSQFLMRVYLKGQDCDLDIAENGHLTIERARNQEYDLILMDLDMPELDGVQAARIIRELERADGKPPVPIVAVTAHVSNEAVQGCEDAGFTEFLAKPVTKKAVVALLEKYS